MTGSTPTTVLRAQKKRKSRKELDVADAIKEAGLAPRFQQLFFYFGIESVEDLKILDNEGVALLEETIQKNGFKSQAGGNLDLQSNQKALLGRSLSMEGLKTFEFPVVEKRKLLTNLRIIVERELQSALLSKRTRCVLVVFWFNFGLFKFIQGLFQANFFKFVYVQHIFMLFIGLFTSYLQVIYNFSDYFLKNPDSFALAQQARIHHTVLLTLTANQLGKIQMQSLNERGNISLPIFNQNHFNLPIALYYLLLIFLLSSNYLQQISTHIKQILSEF